MNLLVFIFIFGLSSAGFSECTLSTLESPPSFTHCINADVFAHQSTYEHKPYSYEGLNGRIYSAMHWQSIASLHWQGRVDYQSKKLKDVQKHLFNDFFYLQVGNPAFQKIHVSIGYKQLPFGTNLFDYLGGVNRDHQPDFFWASPKKSLTFSTNNHINFNTEWGFSLSDDSKLAASSRITYDSPATKGARLVLSFLSLEDAEQRYGFNLIHSSTQNSYFQFEWVRIQRFINATLPPYEQILRLGYVAPIKDGGRPLFLYDDVRREHRVFYLGYEKFYDDLLSTIYGVSYLKRENQIRPLKNWSLFLALGTRL